ncbi:MAG: hypothetical protein ACJ76H_14425 [Bacteriovoracaceae bacterium]
MKTILTVLVLATSLAAYADHHEEKDKMGHDKEHAHVKMDKKDHEHDPAHHKAHDHKAHHPEHKKEEAKKP